MVLQPKCDKIPKTLTIIKVKDQPHIFGGYSEVTWEGMENSNKIQMRLYLVW